MSDGGKTRDNNVPVMSNNQNKYKLHTMERCVVYFHTVFQCFNGHHIILDQFVEAGKERW